MRCRVILVIVYGFKHVQEVSSRPSFQGRRLLSNKTTIGHHAWAWFRYTLAKKLATPARDVECTTLGPGKLLSICMYIGDDLLLKLALRWLQIPAFCAFCSIIIIIIVRLNDDESRVNRSNKT